MIVYLLNHTFHYETEKVIRIFYPNASLDFTDELPQGDITGDFIRTLVDERPDKINVSALVSIGGEEISHDITLDDGADEKAREKYLAVCLYHCLSSLTGLKPPWGILTGVRPAKLMARHIREGSPEEAVKYFEDVLLVSPQKSRLACEVALAEEKITENAGKNDFSLYVSIPFCTTRCSYCSFVSHSIASASALLVPYTDCLCREIGLLGRIAREKELNLKSVYVGGGTPTAIGARELERILAAITSSFDIKSDTEFTVEAGRPDTISREKLSVMKNASVNRISVNPQTFSDEVLRNIGRSHSSSQVYDAFALARSSGFDNINMDLIAGLPGDSVEGFALSVKSAIGLEPENITVHTLALKRSSELATEKKYDMSGGRTDEMLNTGYSLLRSAGYSPYYMYRQSKSSGNLENTGWTVPGKFCAYNVYQMEETHSVFAAGAGAVTKLVFDPVTDVRRVFNFKYPYEYINRFSEILERKSVSLGG